MRVIIAGGREFDRMESLIMAVVDSGFQIDEVVNGGALGVDSLARRWAKHKDLPCRTFNADWQHYGKSAGPIRNREMAEYADALIAIWDGQSRGTKNMIEEATKRGLKVHIHRYTP